MVCSTLHPGRPVLATSTAGTLTYPADLPNGAGHYVLCRNEGGAAFMASAYGKLTGSPGICFVTRGPGATNASIGVHTAMQDSSPMMLFVGQVGTDMKGREAFQEVDYRAVFGTLAKWAVEIDSVARLPEIVARAWATAQTGRPGPVVIALPEDMLTELTDVEPLTGPSAVFEAAPAADALIKSQDLLSKASKPLILIGGTNWTDRGRSALQSFAETSDIPAVAAFRYQDQFDNHSPVFVGEAGVGMLPHVKALIRDADVILAINVRFGELTTDGYTLLSIPQPRQKLVHVHISDREIGKIYSPTLGVHAGPNSFAQSLAPVQGAWSSWRAEARTAYENSFDAPVQPGLVDMVAVTAHLRNVVPDDVIVTNGAGNFTVWPNKFFKFGPKSRLLAPQSGAMGYGLPAAIAAKATYPERTVICFAGDGDFQMNCQELGTAMQAGAQPIILILNNGIYGTIRAHQERNYPARVSGTSLQNPDFVGLAKSYGFHAERVETTAAFASAFGRALASKTGAVLELIISPEALTPRQTLTQMRNAALKSKKANA
ncbi:thiamine pyrophosphate-dependent enzyme [Mesorhizobium sp. Root552]|uniref:thiamine pyrophosphate-dependent enzyme n=1 Tax=Mesorhizobium sp. Root552 TaxID=1736555 RepID=UPI0009EC5DEE|nr:thiamine pyrophosphate-dependent enzyme [Mesorhizobium sp. Root552]